MAPPSEARVEVTPPEMTLAEATAALTAPGQDFEMQEPDHPGHPHPHLEVGSGHSPISARAVHPPRGQGLPGVRRRAGLLRRALPDRLPDWPAPSSTASGVQPRRPCGHRHAQPARVGHGLLGLHRRRGRRRAAQCLVDRRRTGLRTVLTRVRAWSSPTRSAVSGSSPTSARHPDLRTLVVCCEEPGPEGGRRAAQGSVAERPGREIPCPWCRSAN